VTGFDALVFDLDGTLIDSHRDIADALNLVLAEIGRPAHGYDEIKTMIGHGVETLLVRGIGNRDAQLLSRARGLFRETYRARLLRTTLVFEGLRSVLSTLADHGKLLVVATNKPSFFTDTIIRSLALDQSGIAAWASADEAGARKPDARVVTLALERGARARGASLPSRDETLYVGDMPVDIETARVFGCPVAGVAWGFDPLGTRGANPDYWVPTPRTLLDIGLGCVSEEK
jgi:phosphoglycolate phosphatase